MTTANQKGGFLKTLTITRDGSSESNTMLKNNFLKKTENYFRVKKSFEKSMKISKFRCFSEKINCQFS